MSPNNNEYSKDLRSLSRNLRNDSTKSEIRLWCELLRGKRMFGFQFLRQRAIDRYIADFFCKDLMLVIELDGLTHNWEETIAKDIKKQKDLEAMGFTVMRFTDDEVMNYINNVRRNIEGWITTNHADKIKGQI
jgi:very-short-patch-repair endonuclease